MKYTTISELTKTYDISTRSLRYYDEIGLLVSKRKDDYAYRVYDEADIVRLQEILVLRKLRVPLKNIALIIKSSKKPEIVRVLQESLRECVQELEALKIIRETLELLIGRFSLTLGDNSEGKIADDEAIVDIIHTISLSKNNLKERHKMEGFINAEEIVTTARNLRIVYLAPATVVSSHCFGRFPESSAQQQLDEFIRKQLIPHPQSTLRQFGFNNPSPIGDEEYGYEFIVSIPPDIEVQKPLVKKQFMGGIYVAHCIKMGDFSEWQQLQKWVDNSDEYEYDRREPLGMGGCLEEHLNTFSYYSNDTDDSRFTQLDLLIPVRKKQKDEEYL